MAKRLSSLHASEALNGLGKLSFIGLLPVPVCPPGGDVSLLKPSSMCNTAQLTALLLSISLAPTLATENTGEGGVRQMMMTHMFPWMDLLVVLGHAGNLNHLPPAKPPLVIIWSVHLCPSDEQTFGVYANITVSIVRIVTRKKAHKRTF